MSRVIILVDEDVADGLELLGINLERVGTSNGESPKHHRAERKSRGGYKIKYPPETMISVGRKASTEHRQMLQDLIRNELKAVDVNSLSRKEVTTLLQERSQALGRELSLASISGNISYMIKHRELVARKPYEKT